MAAGVYTDSIVKILLSDELDFTDETLGKKREAALLERVKRLVRDDRVELMKDLDGVCTRPQAPRIADRGIEILLIADDEQARISPEYDYTFSIVGDYRRAHSNGNLMAKIASARAALLKAKFSKLEDSVNPHSILLSLRNKKEYSHGTKDEEVLEKRIGLYKRHLAKLREEHNPAHARLVEKYFLADRLFNLIDKLLDPQIKTLEQIIQVLAEVQLTLNALKQDSVPIFKELSETILLLIRVSLGNFTVLDQLFALGGQTMLEHGSQWLLDRNSPPPAVERLLTYKKMPATVFGNENERLMLIKDCIECMALLLRDIKETSGSELVILEKTIGFGPVPGTKAPARPRSEIPVDKFQQLLSSHEPKEKKE